jgi:hypothetical protein
MPNYFFRVREEGQVPHDDPDAEEFADLDAARANAVRGAREILCQAVMAGTAASLNMRIEVQDETSKPLFTVNCGYVVGSDTQS